MTDSAQMTQYAELWVCQNLVRADITSDYDTRHILTDGQTVYIWYDGDEPVRLAASDDMSAEDLAGIPDYESILGFPVRAIMEAELVQMDQNDGNGTVYVSAVVSDITQNYWISLDTGLLFRQQMLQDEKTVYSLEQTELEILADGDDAFSSVFCLPDSSEPFTAE